MKRWSHGSQLKCEDIKETFKKFTQQLNHKIDLCKKDLFQSSVKKLRNWSTVGLSSTMFFSVQFLSSVPDNANIFGMLTYVMMH